MNKNNCKNWSALTGRFSCRGFTLAELLVVVAIVAILVAISITIFTSKLEAAREATCSSNCRSLKSELTNSLISGEEIKGLEGTIISNESLREYYGDNFDYDTFCPEGGVISAVRFNNYDASKGAGFEPVEIDVYCTKHNQSTEWAKGMYFTKGDLMTTVGQENTDTLIFKCLSSHKTGSRSNTRNPAVKSNKGSWEVIGTVDGSIPKYSAVVRYAIGFVVQYNGNKYARTSFNLTGGQTPYSKSSSRYWVLCGKMT